MSEQEFIPDFDARELAVREDTAIEPVPTQDMLQAFGVDPEKQLAILKKVAELAPQINKYRSIIIQSFTYASDWIKFGSGDKAIACCKNAGVMRIVDKGNFPIRFRDVIHTKEDIIDESGRVAGYNYVFEGYGEMAGRSVHCIAEYGTKEAFLGKSGGEWRDWREINSSHLRQSAHSYFKGKVVKDLLGLGAIPWHEFEKMAAFAGQVVEQASSVEYKGGSQGGTSEIDRTTQNSLFDTLRELGNQGLVVRWAEDRDDRGKFVRQYIGDPSPAIMDYYKGTPTPENLAVASLSSLQTWFNDQGKLIKGKGNFDTVSGKQLKLFTGKKIPDMMKEFEDGQGQR